MSDRIDRIVRAEQLAPIYEPLAALTEAVLERTGRHGIARVSLTPDIGLSFGIVPGTSAEVATSAGPVEVYAEAEPRVMATFAIRTAFGTVPVFSDPTLPPNTIEIRSGDHVERVTLPDLPGPDAVMRGLEKLRNESRSVERAARIDAAIARIEADACELAKADRRTAEQERIIAKQRAEIDSLRARIETQATWVRSRNPLENGKVLLAANERMTNEGATLRAALAEALDAWLGHVESEQMADSHEDRRIAELRKLTEAP